MRDATGQGERSNYTEIVLTGGPGAGKSSALSYLTEQLANDGIRTLCVPEAATIVIGAGISDISRIAREDHPHHVELQRQMTLICGSLRERFRALAESFAPEQVCIIYDRAELDAVAYIGAEELERIVAGIGSGRSLVEIRDSYDCVIHLRSAATYADGSAYTTANNPARQETDAAQARAADARTLEAWLGHPHLWVVESSAEFADKLERVTAIVRHSLGAPAPYEIERKFLLSTAPDLDQLGSWREIEIEQVYLACDQPGVERRIRRRSEAEASSYRWTEKRAVTDSTVMREEREALITAREYERLLVEADPGRSPLHKIRYSFVHGEHHFELDHFIGPDIWVLEVELIAADERIELPPYLRIAREVTDDLSYRSAALAASAGSA